MKIVAWWSAGITSAVAVKLALNEYGADNVDIIYFGISSAHPDNARFMSDCEKWYGKQIETVTNKKFEDQFDVIEARRFINSPNGAPCTSELKNHFVSTYKNNVITMVKSSDSSIHQKKLIVPTVLLISIPK